MRSVSGVDQAIARVAAGQHRAISGTQLRAAGLSKEAIRYRVQQSRLQRLWRDVYLLGPMRPDPLSLAMGAVLATGRNGVLSHGWAAWLWGFVAEIAKPVEISVTSGSHRGRPGIVIHRANSLDTTRKRGMPVVTPAQACLDLAATTTRTELERLVAEAQVKGIVRESQLQAIIAHNPRRPGAALLKAVLANGPQYTRAKSERLMLALVRDADLPPCQTNAKVLDGRYEADFLWPGHKLIVEVDGYATHGHRRAFELDRRRNANLIAAGYIVMQITYRQLTDEPLAIAARIAAALARAEQAA
jgi:very-short-patch-repair endonuclease